MAGPTMKMIAEAAGVGRSTVSLVLSGRSSELGIRPETSQRVFEAAKRLNYRTNYLARGLRGKSTLTIGVVWSFSVYRPHAMMHFEMTRRIYERGYQPLVVNSLNDSAKMLADLEELRGRHVDGLVVSMPSRARHSRQVWRALEAHSAVVVVLDGALRSLHSLSSGVVFERDCAPAITQAVEHLAARGRRRIAMITSITGNHDKIRAFRSTLRRLGLSAERACVIDTGRSTSREGPPLGPFDRAVRLARPEAHGIDALLCTCDEGAAAVLAYFRERGVAVPEEVAVVGFNNDPFCSVLDPPLASLGWRNTRAAGQIEKLLFAQIEGHDFSDQDRIQRVPMEFVWRPSAG